MLQKRKLAEFSGGGSDTRTSSKKHRGNLKAVAPQYKPKGPRRSSQQSQDSEPKANSTTSLKSRIRDLKRLLEYADNDASYKIPATVRIERERELETCKYELAEKKAVAREAEYRKKMIGKYHQVRFFDRQKATRILKRLRRQLVSLEDRSKKESLLRQIHTAEVDLNYALYYPLMKPYSSLYPRAKREQSKSEEPAEEDELSGQHREEQSQGHKGDPEVWRAVERAMEEGTLDALRNSRVAVRAPEPKDDSRTKQKKSKGDKKKIEPGIMQQMLKDTKAAAAVVDEEDESDGGFFE
ncbi:hypothetical protein K469DRAFT_584364 [Zopfia rhizophila CBS 207.26]|uniref:rRNA-processing protein EFG1 n=1 Tax=Zopfia rhizophila CBS 207.26 TaxID=1314779 RepID=A0A6A6DXR8_9PEZI|nr:hypothetical protein K469DRAFT_584364 [Zopfia rhizophila CBS 207.26]